MTLRSASGSREKGFAGCVSGPFLTREDEGGGIYGTTSWRDKDVIRFVNWYLFLLVSLLLLLSSLVEPPILVVPADVRELGVVFSRRKKGKRWL